MAKPPIRIRRSAVPGAIPTTAQLALGELAVNTWDGKAFLKKDNGVQSIVELGGGGGAYTSPTAIALYEKTNSGTADSFDGTETRFQLRDTSGDLVAITSALYLAVSVNGVVQKPNTGIPSSPFEGFYVTANATQGYDIVFDTAPSAGSDYFIVLAGTFTATSGTSGIKILDDISSQFDGTDTTFTLTYNSAAYAPEFLNSVVVSVGGVLQVPTDAYSISGSTITFTSAPPTGTSFYALSFEVGEAVDGVTAVTATSPLASSGGTTPVISIQDGTTTQKGAVQLEDSTSSASTTKAATPNSVKSAYDLADAALPESGGTMTGALGVTAGSASSPSVFITGDTNTGIYSPGADQVAISSSGSERIRIGANGQIGLSGANYGTSGQVLTSAGSGAAPTWTTPSAGNTDKIEEGNTSAEVIDTGSDGRFVVTTEGSERLRVDSSGRLGLGTSSPSNNLHVLGSAGTTVARFTDATNGSLLFNFSSSQSRILDGGNNSLWAYDNSGNNSIFYTNNTERLRIDSSGRLGLGSSNPQHLLDCASIGRFTGSTNSAASGAGIEIGYDSGNTTGFIQSYNRATSAYLSTAVDGSNVRLKINGAEKARLTSTGLGIGTTSPSVALQVVGTGRFGDGTNGIVALTSSANQSYYDSLNNAATGFQPAAFRATTLQFLTDASGTPTERARIDSSGRLLVGTSTARANFFRTIGNSPLSAFHQIEGAANATSRITSQVYGASSDLGPAFVLAKHRGNSIGGNTIIQGGDVLGEISFQGNDGSNFIEGVNIKATVDPNSTYYGSDWLQGQLTISVRQGNVSTPAMQINSQGTTELYSSGGGSSLSITSSDSSGFAAMMIGFYGGNGFSGGSSGQFSLYVQSNGNIYNQNGVYSSFSDFKLKENIVDAGSQWDDLKALRVRKYNLKEGQTHTQIGLIAQEVELVSPGLVADIPDRDKDDNELDTVTKTVKYSVLYMKAVKALQEAMERIETLEASNADLVARVTALEGN